MLTTTFILEAKQYEMKKLNNIPLEVSIHLRYMYQDKGVRGKKLLNLYPQFSGASVYRHAKKKIFSKDLGDKRRFNKGRPPKLSQRDKRAIMRQIPILRKAYGSFTAKQIRVAAGIPSSVHDECIRNVLRQNGYKFLHARKKGLMSANDLKERLKFARKVKRLLSTNVWQEGISFYLDGAGFQHKYNPCDEARSSKTLAWRRKKEALHPGCTAKGSHVGSGGNVAHFLVAIAYKRGVILCEQYHGKINGDMFSKFIEEHFPRTFESSANPRGKLFLQDGDPSQNSKKAKQSMDKIGVKKFNIPARSPDLNPIENVFNYVKVKLHEEALRKDIKHENFEQYSNRVKRSLLNCPVSYIDSTIESMGKRISLDIQAKGKRIKY